MRHDDRHHRILQQLLTHRLLSSQELKKKAQLGCSEKEFGMVMDDLAEQAGGDNPRLPVEWWWSQGMRYYQLKRL
jgi:hypothetical protein